MGNMMQTKQMIRTAFLQLLEERTLNKITVRDITDRCGINRNTFYYHYQDIPALLEEICSDEVERIVREYPSIQSLEDCLDTALQFAMQNRRAILHIYNSDNRSTYANCLWRICEHTVRTYVDTVLDGRRVNERDKELIIRYHKCACFGWVVDCISRGMRDDILDDMHRICQLKKDAAEDLLRRKVRDQE